MKIKICGLTTVEEAEYLNENNVDFAGMVLYFPKSKRNIDIKQAKKIMGSLNNNIKKVAVVVSPTIEQVKNIESAGFDFVQIHKELPEDLFKETSIPVLKAFNVNDLDEIEKYKEIDNVKGYVFDAPTYGSGKTFDWSLLENVKRDDKLFILAGGLNADHVAEGIKAVNPDGVDVSSGVENDNGVGKSREKIKQFVEAARM